MTPAQIIEGIGQPVRQGADGRFQCPVCDYSQDNYRMGPHMVKHWWEAGVEKGTEPHSGDKVACPVDECEFTSRRGTMAGHLRGQHGYAIREASAAARVAGFSLTEYKINPPPNRHANRQTAADKRKMAVEAAKADHKAAKAKVPAVVEPEPAQTGQIPGAGVISGTDAALAVIMGVANGHIATELLPEVVNYVDHTRDIVDKLRAK